MTPEPCTGYERSNDRFRSVCRAGLHRSTAWIGLPACILLAVGCGRLHYSPLPDPSDGATEAPEAGPGEAGLDAGTTDAGPPRRIVELTLGAQHTCALLEDGRVRCWGSNAWGQLGTPGAAAVGDDEHPYAGSDVELGEAAVQVTAGALHTCALTTSGTILCWGRGDAGQLGYGNLETVGDDEMPASVGPVPLGGTVAQVSAGRDHTCTLLDNGELRCWGMNFSGVLGQGNTEHVGDDEPANAVDPVMLGLEVQEVHSGGRHTCVVALDGRAYCWGRNVEGQLGRGDTVPIGDDEVPAGSLVAVEVGRELMALVTGEFHSCAIRPDAGLLCWGWGHAGRLGYGNADDVGDNEIPRTVGPVPIGAAVSDVAPGLEFTCALLTGGAVRCFGRNNASQLGVPGLGTIGDSEPASSAPAVELGRTDVVAVETGDVHACALFADGTTTCWGGNADGQLGYAHTREVGENEDPAAEGTVRLTSP